MATDNKPPITALVVGNNGQDGRLLENLLLSQGCTVIGLSRSSLHANGKIIPGYSVVNHASVNAIMAKYSPAEIYYLAGHHTSSELRGSLNPIEEYRLTQEVHVLGLIHCLEVMRQHCPSSRIFYAASSLIFQGGRDIILDENTPIAPQGFYGQSKADGLFVCQEYRRKHGVFTVGGILFNHESRLRPSSFVSRKIAEAAARIKLGLQSRLTLGSLDAVIDWSHASDFVSAYVDVLRRGDAGEYIFASGQGHSIKDFVECAFDYVQLDWRSYVDIKPHGVMLGNACRIGNPTKLAAAIDWEKRWTFEAMVTDLVAHELEVAR